MMKKLIILLLPIILFACSSKRAMPGKSQVLVTAHSYVKKQLKAPTTAMFSGELYRDMEDSTYYITGNVEAQNSYGAQLRNNYTMKIKYLGGDASQDSAWKVEQFFMHE